MIITADNLDIEVTAEEVLKGQGIDPQQASGRLLAGAEQVVAEANRLIEPVALLAVVEVTGHEGERIDFAGGYFEGALAARALEGAEQLNIAVCTIGGRLEEKVRELMGADPVTAFALDGAGIAAVGKVSRSIEDIISTEACSLNLDLGMRAQPGQEGWPIEQQRQVFKVLPAETIGVSLTESCLMIPRKSVSFVIGRGRSMKDSIVPCDICSKRPRCNWRKEKRTG